MATSRCTIDQVNKSFKHHLLLKNYKKIIPKYVLGTALEIDSKKVCGLGSGCGSVGTAFASDSRDPWFESSHRQKIILNIYCQQY